MQLPATQKSVTCRKPRIVVRGFLLSWLSVTVVIRSRLPPLTGKVRFDLTIEPSDDGLGRCPPAASTRQSEHRDGKAPVTSGLA